MTRDSGILLHPTCLSGSPGIGDLGPAASAWIEWLAATGCKYWQLLPLGPTGYADSPYQCFSAFAGNPYLISPQGLVENGLLDPDDAVDHPETGAVSFGEVIPWKMGLLRRAHRRIDSAGLRPDFGRFRTSAADWLDDFALFMALKTHHGGGSYHDWPPEIRTREPAALSAARRTLAPQIEQHAFDQYLFFRQWDALRDHAGACGIEIIGDIPIFVAEDSADVWANPSLFRLGADSRPTAVAGVPPDWFSPTGQLWGNPHYDWAEHAGTGWSWWIERLRTLFGLVDMVRIDHFRAFADFWEIPAGSPTAETGRWVDGPGIDFFEAIRNALGPVPIIAEDLGELHDVVPALLAATGLPGMHVAQMSLWPDDIHPPNWPVNSVGYTGTHDNQTSRSWLSDLPPEDRSRVLTEIGTDGTDISWDLLRMVWDSPSALAVAPLQDFLRLDDTARMNSPGTVGPHNWTWRMATDALTPALQDEITTLNRESDRTAQSRR